MNRAVLIGALIIGAILVVVMMRGGASSSQIRTLAPLPPGDDGGDKLAAFSTVAEVAREQVRGDTELALANVQASVETLRINQAYNAVLSQNQTQAAIARQQARAQNRSGFFDFVLGLGQTIFPFLRF